MFYKIVVEKKESDVKSMVLRATSEKEIELMIPSIKDFLYPGEDTTKYNYFIGRREIEPYTPGVKLLEFQITVYRQKNVIEDNQEGLLFDDFYWYDDIIEAESEEEAKNKVYATDCRIPNVNFEECNIYINEVPVSMLVEEATNSLFQRIENGYIGIKYKDITIREWRELQTDPYKNAKLKYDALKYMRAVFAIATHLSTEKIDVEKMSAKEYIELVNNLALLIDNKEEFDKLLNEARIKWKNNE